MGLDIGVVKISYLHRPEQPIYDFLWEIVHTAAYDAGCEYWGGVWEGNAVVEMQRRKMLMKARKYAREKGIIQGEAEKLISWVRRLPWDGSTIMLHLNW